MSKLGLTNFIPSLSIPSHGYGFTFSTITLTFKPRKPHPIPLFASSNNNNNEEKEKGGNSQQQQQSPSSSNGQEQKRPLFGFNWSNLLDPDPDNVLALGLTGLLTWASVQVLCQLLFISFAIIVAALKYSFIAALLIFILIALL
ncbi:uncharacterized protein LOC127094941 [Lathyrus oleraceus]|uniref:Transmembrane protein n=1 Tax=Pisum sativum TaxID=3888 RepID=A0A9D5A666_PEA|nr:uncharacterized protein LOC127094941 [Pisum sativum]KAI5396939.1 hypothetical protein KIW84_062954 [Pisum sativum]